MINSLNEKIFFLINHAVGVYPLLDGFFLFVTNFVVESLIVLSVFWFFIVLPRGASNFKEKLLLYKQAFVFILVLLSTWTITEFIKGSVSFARPFQILEGVKSLSIHGSYDSFPSLHTAFSFAIATYIYFYNKRVGLMLFGIATIVGISRIFVGVHFPLDVIFGAFVGSGISLLFVKLFKQDKISFVK